MLNSGPAGFENAPITKAILLATAGASILFSIMDLKGHFNISTESIRQLQLWRLVTMQTFFSTPGELLFGSLLIYNFRLFERQMGSIKFGGFAFVTLCISTLIQLGAIVLNLPFSKTTTGPYSFIFACMVLFYFDIPVTKRFRVCGINANDKLFTYIFGLQLLFSNFPTSFISGIGGILSGIAYRSETFRLNRFQFPPIITNFCSRFILPLLQSPPRPRSSVTQQPRMFNFPQNRGNQHPGPFQRTNPIRPPTQPPEEMIQILTNMGFAREEVIRALETTNGDIQLATNLLLDQ